jgi:hypothetical protein
MSGDQKNPKAHTPATNLPGDARAAASQTAAYGRKGDAADDTREFIAAESGRAAPSDGFFDLGTIFGMLVIMALAGLAAWWYLQRGERGERRGGRRRGRRSGRLEVPDDIRPPSSPIYPAVASAQPRPQSSHYPTDGVVFKQPAHEAERAQPPRQPVSLAARPAPRLHDAERSMPSSSIATAIDYLVEIRGMLHQLLDYQSAMIGNVSERLGAIEAHFPAQGGVERTALAGVERAAAASRWAPPSPRPTPSADHESLEDRLLQKWNDVDWDQGTPSLSQIEQLLQDESYDLVEGIVGAYALAVPHRAADDWRTPIYILPLLRKANTHYDVALFVRPEQGDSAWLRAPAKVQFAEHGGSRTALLERLKAGNERLTQVFKVIEQGRIE